MVKVTINIKGMHCRSCELLIESSLKKIEGVKDVLANYHHAKADIFSDRKIDIDRIGKVLTNLGYEIGEEGKKAFFSKNLNDYRDLAINLLILALLYFLFKKTGLFNLGSAFAQKSSNLPTVFLIGITAGLSTCMAIVGGLVLAISARHAEKHPEASAIEKFRPHLFFNLGRIVSFFLLGGLIGLIGNVFQLSSPALGITTIFVGLIMLVLGLQLTEISPRLKSFSFTLPTKISKLLGIRNHHQKEYSHKNSFILGGSTFFLPCGFTQAMQILAISSGSFWSGALIMAVFALGTMPGLIGIGGLTSLIKGIWAKRFFKFVGAVVMIFAFINFNNGSNLLGLSINLPSSKADNTANATIENGIQIIKMDQLSTKYSPNSFIVKQGIPTRLIINSQDSNSCASSIILTKFGIKRYLVAGENIIDFIPKETGKFKFTCSMGMYTGTITVIENSQSISQIPANFGQSNKDNGDYSQATVLNATYTYYNDIQPQKFYTKINQPTILSIEVKENGYGCMGSITIPGLYNEIENLKKGENLSLKFTPKEKGTYKITCGMGSPRAYIYVE